MSNFLYIAGVLSFGFGLLVMLGAKSAIHEIEAGVAFIIMILCVGFAVASSMSSCAPRRFC
jgi:Mn2+/Fe2+ NRAMP family transporter